MRTFTTRLSQLMAERDLGVLALARLVPCDRGYISRLARGRQQPSRQIARRLDELLHAGGELADLADDARRGPFGPERPAWRDAGPSADADSIRETSRMLITMERRLGGDAILPAAVQAFHAAQESAGDDRGRQAAAGEAGEVASWIAYDAQRPGMSRRLSSEALTLSREAGDRDMELFLGSHLAMLDVEQARPASALRVASAILQSRLSPRAEAIFLIRRGRSLVRLGRERDGFADLRRARSLVSGGIGSGDPWWTFWADESEVAWQEGTARGDLGDWRAAVPLLRAAAESRAGSHGKRTVFHDQASLLEALARAGAWQDARPVIGEMASAGRLITSARTTAVLGRTSAYATAHGPADVAEAVRDLAA